MKAVLKQKVNVFIAGEALLAAKKKVVGQCVENAESEGSSLAAAEEKAQAVFCLRQNLLRVLEGYDRPICAGL